MSVLRHDHISQNQELSRGASLIECTINNSLHCIKTENRQSILRHPWQLERACGMIALVRHRDDIVAEPERKEQLGRMGHERDDPHLRAC